MRDATEVWLSALADRHESFRTLVRNAAILRLQDNRASLEAWRTFMQTEISPMPSGARSWPSRSER